MKTKFLIVLFKDLQNLTLSHYSNSTFYHIPLSNLCSCQTSYNKEFKTKPGGFRDPRRELQKEWNYRIKIGLDFGSLILRYQEIINRGDIKAIIINRKGWEMEEQHLNACHVLESAYHFTNVISFIIPNNFFK